MKVLVAIAFTLALVWAAPRASAAVDATDEPAITRVADTEPLPPRSAAEDASGPNVLDLSLFGIVALGVAGLFWIRRHTSEL
ncbi:MAG: hypothetical protein PVF57_00665 [Pseudomonadales bacterium]|jgi:hypothetical protein